MKSAVIFCLWEKFKSPKKGRFIILTIYTPFDAPKRYEFADVDRRLLLHIHSDL